MSYQSANPIKVEGTTLLINSSAASNDTLEDGPNGSGPRPTVSETHIDGVLICTRSLKEDRTYNYSSPAIYKHNDDVLLFQLDQKKNIVMDIPYKTVRFMVPFAVTGSQVLPSEQDQHISSATLQLFEWFVQYGYTREEAKKVLQKMTVTWVNVGAQHYIDIGWHHLSPEALRPQELVLHLKEKHADGTHRLPYVGQGILSSLLPVYLPNFSPSLQEDMGKKVLDALTTAFSRIGHAREIWQHRRTVTGNDKVTMMLTTYVVIIELFVAKKGVDKLCLTSSSQIPNTFLFDGHEYKIFHFNHMP